MTDIAHSHTDDHPLDGQARYRTDGLGERVVVLPATCKRGLHQLPAAGFRAVAEQGWILVECLACGEGDQVSQWRLTTCGAVAERAEFDDQPYAGHSLQ
ncbi:hypothetical protein [Amycolatopsis albispora]|uniref:Uncharacterized protein n=1 Tax=Amycolatopsis albispora TaxID=1804986 RepID=A0A344L6K8_9PSEU|nr:hypothetical protein [Amycolatopsis albispora]AXB43682.1 hypothetical protein A4R43_15015 [Amycolatopsis albispora]